MNKIQNWEKIQKIMILIIINIILPVTFNIYADNPLSGLKYQPIVDENITNTDWVPTISENNRAVSKFSGTAPLAVHFFSDFVETTNSSKIIDRFNHYDYTWYFDDPGCGNWGTTGLSRNIAKGALTTHVFESPGIYNVKLVIKDHDGTVDTENHTITVVSQDDFYSGSKTICVSDTSHNNFSGAPAGALCITTDNISSITSYATAGHRILFQRGSSWSVSELDWPNNSGPVYIGAYGTGTGQDELGIYSNAPQIIIGDGNFLPLAGKQNWTIAELSISSSATSHSAISGAMNIQSILFSRLKITGFSNGISISHWNDGSLMEKNDLVVYNCDISDSYEMGLWIGGERIAILGNKIYNSKHSHVSRVWLAYRSIISNNMISGAGQEDTKGLAALKFHGTGEYPETSSGTDSFGTPVSGTGLSDTRTEYSIISDNIFGSAGPTLVAISPQNSTVDERLTNIIFERNRLHTDFGDETNFETVNGLALWASYSTIRNNIFDGTGSDDNYIGIGASNWEANTPAGNCEIYNNTIYRGDSTPPEGVLRAIKLHDSFKNLTMYNNIASYPYGTSGIVEFSNIEPETSDMKNNYLINTPVFINPDASDPLDRNFKLSSSCSAYGMGIEVPVFIDINFTTRPSENNNCGAIE